MANFVCAGDAILLRKKDYPENVSSKTIIVMTSSTSPAAGEVLAVGPGGYDNQGVKWVPECKPGDLAIFRPLGGWEPIMVNGEQLYIGRARDLLGVYEPEGVLGNEKS